MLRLDENTPVQKALKEAKRNTGKKKKGNFTTWIKVVNEDLARIEGGLTLEDNKTRSLAENRDEWNKLIERVSSAQCPQVANRRAS